MHPARCTPLFLTLFLHATHAAAEQRTNPFDPGRVAPPAGETALLASQGLEHFELVQLRMVGTLSDQSRRIGLIQDPAQRIYLVSPGSRIGPDGGIVEKIDNSAVWLKESFLDSQGVRRTRTTTLRLAP
jgi:Tfp pilus assembly protein PilP